MCIRDRSPDDLLAAVRKGYGGQGGPLTPLSLSTSGKSAPVEELRANAILKGLDNMNMYRIAAFKTPFSMPVRDAVRYTSGFGGRDDPLGRGFRPVSYTHLDVYKRQVQNQPITGAENIHQIRHMQITHAAVFGQQQPRRGTGPGGPCRNQRLGQIKVEIGQVHWPEPFRTGGPLRKISRNMPGVRIERGLTSIWGSSAVPRRV